MNRRAGLVLIAAVILTGPAFGHAKLLSSSPAANAELAVAPTELSLQFSEAAQLAVLKLSAAGVAIPLKIDRGATAAVRISIALPPLAPGIYRVEWTALAADDGHVTKGTFSFTVAGAPR